MIDSRPFQVKTAGQVKLSKLPTSIPDLCDSKSEYTDRLAKSTERLEHLQNLLYADDHFSLLVIFQAMDAAGKDSAIQHVMSGVNPQGCQVFSFKAPSAEELDHDFLWRTTRCLPERGRIGIFNRSYYEEVLVVRVHPEFLDKQHLPEATRQDKDLWSDRFASINDFEKHLTRNGTHVVKIFLHLSKDEQRKRFLKRLDDPEKNWKFSAADLQERDRWDDYQKAYEEMLEHTSTKDAPWHVIPADEKKNARLLISDAIIRRLEAMPLKYPVSTESAEELKLIRERLETRD